MNRFQVFVILLFSLSLTFAFAGESAGNIPGKTGLFPQTFSERSPGNFDAAAYLNNQQETFSWLMSESVPLSPDSIISIEVDQEDLAGIENYQCKSCGGLQSTDRKVRIGVVKPASFPVSLDRLPASSLSRTPEGGYVWTAAVESPGATALRVHFTDFSLPPNAELYFYNMDGTVFGPYRDKGYTKDGDFWTNTVSGSVAFLQLRLYSPATVKDLQDSHFVVQDIGYLGEKFLLPFLQRLDKYRGPISSTLEHCSFNEPCVEDASCYSGGVIDDAKYAVGHMQWVSGAWIYYCSGGLVADTVDTSQVPYFLTANHCISKSKDSKNLECFWQYWTDSCQGACYDPVGVVPRTLGADILSSDKTGDYTLMQLWDTPPAGSVFMGWTAEPVAFTDGTELFRISYPQGAPQAYSRHEVDINAGTCTGWPRGDWIYSRDVIGATEGGSSGSPVYNLSGQIVGQLSGACGTNVDDVCDSVNNATVDGAFATYFNTVKQWLDPTGGTGGESHVQAIDLNLQIRGKNYKCIADVTILDENNNPVAGAEVSGTFSGDVSGSATATTDANGIASFEITKKDTVSTFTFCVDDVTHASYTYTPSANIETCDTY